MHWQGFGCCHLPWHAWERRLGWAYLRGRCSAIPPPCFSVLTRTPGREKFDRSQPHPSLPATSHPWQPSGVCSFWLTHTTWAPKTKNTHSQTFVFLAWKWADGQRKCVISRNAQSERTWLIGLQGKIDRLYVSQPSSLSSFHSSISLNAPFLLSLVLLGSVSTVAKSAYYQQILACFSVNMLENIDSHELCFLGLSRKCSFWLTPVCHVSIH